MRFKKGDPLNLEGRVMVFGRFKPNEANSVYGFNYDPESGIVALYASKDEADFREKTGFSGELKQVTFTTKEGFNLPTLFKAACAVSSEQDLIDGEYDVFFVGDFETPALAVEALFLGSMYYALLLKNQSSKKELKLLNAPAETFDFLQTHITYMGAPIRDAVLYSYVIPMCDARRFKRETDYQRLEKELLTFCEGSKFESAALELCETIALSASAKTTELNQLYLGKVDLLIQQMNAVHLEDFSTAQNTKDEIKKIEGKIKENAN